MNILYKVLSGTLTELHNRNDGRGFTLIQEQLIIDNKMGISKNKLSKPNSSARHGDISNILS